MKYIFKMPSEILKMRANWFKKYIHSNFNILDINSLFVKILKILLSEKSSYPFLIEKLIPHEMHLNWLFTKTNLRKINWSCCLLLAVFKSRQKCIHLWHYAFDILHLIVQTGELSSFRRISFFFQNLKFCKDFALFWDHQSYVW